MKDYLKVYRSGAVVYMERTFPSGMYRVLLRDPRGEVYDRVRCDDRADAMNYRRAFGRIARNKWS